MTQAHPAFIGRTLLAIRDPSEFAKFLALTLPKQCYLAARPDAEVPREAVNPGEFRRPPIPEWTLGFDPTLNSWTPVPVDPTLTLQDARHEVCGSPLSPAPGWDWKFDSEAGVFERLHSGRKRRFRNGRSASTRTPPQRHRSPSTPDWPRMRPTTRTTARLSTRRQAGNGSSIPGPSD